MALSRGNALSVRLNAAGLQPVVVSQIVQQIDFWLSHSGPEWTVMRLKELKVDFVRLLAHEEPVGMYRKVLRNSVRVPVGVFGYLFLLGLDAATKHRRRKLLLVWNALIAYTGFVSPRVTRAQWRKFSVAVRAEPPQESEMARASYYVSLGLLSLPQSPAYRGNPKPLLTTIPRPGKRVPGDRRTTQPEVTGLLHQAERAYSVDSPSWSNEEINTLLRHVLRDTPMDPGYARPNRRCDSSKMIRTGMIGLIQEPGYKLRAVANPNRCYQLALEPLGRMLFNWLRLIPQDATYNQTKGYYDVQERIASGVTCHSIDLSNATDYFPRRLMYKTLASRKIPRASKTLLEKVASSYWYLPRNSNVAGAWALKWNRGLPLGLYPCFALFALTHHALVRGICRAKGRLDFPYRILGDDIVIWDDSVAVEYKAVMNEMGCPIAASKSITSNRVAEFAGRVILADAILHGQKYGDVDPFGDSSFLETVKSLGPHLIRSLPARQRQVALYWCHLLQPVGPGWNPRGLPIEQRMSMTDAWVEAKAAMVSSVAEIGQISQAQSQWYNEYQKLWSGYSAEWIAPTLPLSTEQVDSLAKMTRLSLWIELVPSQLSHLLSQLGSADSASKDLIRGLGQLRRMFASRYPVSPWQKSLLQSLSDRLRKASEKVPLPRQSI